jgi:hypothetical protein
LLFTGLSETGLVSGLEMKYAKLLQKNLVAAGLVLCGYGVAGQTGPVKGQGTTGQAPAAAPTGVPAGAPTGAASGRKVQISGTVYDGSQRFALQGVSVMGTSGVGTATDSLGRYSILLPIGDSLNFSYLGRGTAKFPVKDMPQGFPFDMSLDVAVDSLPAVMVRSRDYHTDSLENRKEYQKAFDYGYSYVDKMNSGRGGRSVGVGIDLDLLFGNKKRKQMLALQRRLEEEELDKYVDHRFNRALVRRITGLEPPALDSFMRQYRPSKEFIQGCETDYEFDHYIREWGKYFADDWNRDHPAKPAANGGAVKE